RHWAQIFTPLSTSALVVSWLLTLGCDPRDRVSNQASLMMNVHFWFHALSEIPDILVWMKNGQTIEEDTSVKLFWEGSFLMAVEFYLAFQSACDNIIHSNLISGMNIILIFLVVRDGVTEIGEVRQGLEWTTMFLWIVVCLLMAHLTPTVGSVRAKAMEAMVSRSGAGINSTAASNMPAMVNPAGLDEVANNLTLALAAQRRKGSRATGSTSRERPCRHRARKPEFRRGSSRTEGRKSLFPRHRSPAAYRPGAGNGAGGEMVRVSTPTRDEHGEEGWLAVEDDAGDDKEGGSRCCCACWDSFAFWMDQRNTQNNLPVFRLLYFSATVVYFIVMLGVAAGGIKRGYATAVVGVSFASVCSHWLISIEHPTSTMEAVHLLLHACTEAVSVLLWVSERNWTQAVYTLSAFFAVYPCLFYGIQALKLGLHRKFSDHLALVKEAMKIFLRSSVLILVLMYLAFECIGCLNSRPEADCAALLYANTQVGLSVVLGFLSFLGLIVMQDITSRHFLELSFTWPQQVAVLTFSLAAVGLCIFSLASRHFSKLTTDLWEHVIELATLFSWYSALLILWIRRPWYDTAWGENDMDNMSLNEADEEGEEHAEDAASAAGGKHGGARETSPEWVQVPTEAGAASADLV
ncbi:unnamed protein product, partial [Scytosiphon promiscuus]